MTGWASLPLRVKLYISIVVLSAAPFAYHALKAVVFDQQDYFWLILTVLALITVPIFVFLPSVR